MFKTAFRCVLCLKNLYMPGWSPWWEMFYFWLGSGRLYVYKVDFELLTEEHHLCLCPKDYKYIQDNRAIGEMLINIRLCPKE